MAELEAATVAPDDRPPVERPALAVASYLDAVEARLLVWQDLWRGVLAEDDATQEALARVRDSLVARLTSTVSATTTDALPTTPRLRLLAGGWVALVENVTAAWLDGGDLSRADIESLVLASAVVLVPELPEPARGAVLAIARANRPRRASVGATGSGRGREAAHARGGRRSERDVGTAVLRRLAEEPVVTSVVAVARRVPRADGSSTVRFPHDVATWRYADVAASDADQRLDAAFAGADVVVHLAWAIQPSHDRERLRRVNVEGTRRVVEAAQRAGVAHVVVASSVGAYSPAPYAGDARDTPVNEGWPVEGVPGSSYSEDKAAVETLLDDLDPETGIVVSRVRSALVFQRDAGSEIALHFLGPLGTRVLRRDPLPTVPLPDGLRLQVVHADDLADAYARIVVGRAPGCSTSLTPPCSQRRTWPTSSRTARCAPCPTRRPGPPSPSRGARDSRPSARAGSTWRCACPCSTPRWRRSCCAWRPVDGAKDTLAELVDGIRAGAGTSSPPLLPR